MLVLLLCLISLSFGKCVHSSEELYLGICDKYVTYPIWIYENDSVVNDNNNFIIKTLLDKVIYQNFILADASSLQCAMTYPTCIDGKPTGICKSDCNKLFYGLKYNLCDIKMFHDDSQNRSRCTKIVFSAASRIGVGMVILIFLFVLF